MTAEIVVANKIGVALAADSTVTIRSGAGDKTYNTANKIFTVHKLHPVGALIYGSTTINSLPIEVILKEFRASLPDAEKDTLAEYADDFMDFLRNSVPITAADHEENFRAVVQEYCRRLQIDMRRAVVDRQISITDAVAVRGVVRELIQEFRARVHTAGSCPSMMGVDQAALIGAYPNVVEEAVTRAFRLFSPSSSTKRTIVNLIYDACLSNELTYNRMGLVIAGYGRKEYFPSVKSFETDGFFAGQLKIVATQSSEVTNDNSSFVYPFAQSDLATLFMEGVDPVYQEYTDDQVRILIGGLADVAGTFFGSTDRRKIARLRRALTKLSNDMIDDFERRRWEWFVSRTLDAVEFLDKSELAALAESLVSLAALRQKVSLDMETVGGPVDVAVISKGDGFIWINRKYYFQRETKSFLLSTLSAIKCASQPAMERDRWDHASRSSAKERDLIATNGRTNWCSLSRLPLRAAKLGRKPTSY